ncbi:hypothetical protein BGX31_001608 [Mortierella sp. GBA43]|nr:hypothetical protein BGX31_001608 [Mortierella sp. GBA43]
MMTALESEDLELLDEPSSHHSSLSEDDFRTLNYPSHAWGQRAKTRNKRNHSKRLITSIIDEELEDAYESPKWRPRAGRRTNSRRVSLQSRYQDSSRSATPLQADSSHDDSFDIPIPSPKRRPHHKAVAVSLNSDSDSEYRPLGSGSRSMRPHYHHPLRSRPRESSRLGVSSQMDLDSASDSSVIRGLGKRKRRLSKPFSVHPPDNVERVVCVEIPVWKKPSRGKPKAEDTRPEQQDLSTKDTFTTVDKEPTKSPANPPKVLDKWWLDVRGKDEKESDYDRWIIVQGYNKGTNNKMQVLHSHYVTDRIDSRLVATRKSQYRLDGEIDREQMETNGFSSQVVEAFADGFPENWKELLLNHINPEAEQTTEETVDEAKDTTETNVLLSATSRLRRKSKGQATEASQHDLAQHGSSKDEDKLEPNKDTPQPSPFKNSWRPKHQQPDSVYVIAVEIPNYQKTRTPKQLESRGSTDSGSRDQPGVEKTRARDQSERRSLTRSEPQQKVDSSTSKTSEKGQASSLGHRRLSAGTVHGFNEDEGVTISLSERVGRTLLQVNQMVSQGALFASSSAPETLGSNTLKRTESQVEPLDRSLGSSTTNDETKDSTTDAPKKKDLEKEENEQEDEVDLKERDDVGVLVVNSSDSMFSREQVIMGQHHHHNHNHNHNQSPEKEVLSKMTRNIFKSLSTISASSRSLIHDFGIPPAASIETGIDAGLDCSDFLDTCIMDGRDPKTGVVALKDSMKDTFFGSVDQVSSLSIFGEDFANSIRHGRSRGPASRETRGATDDIVSAAMDSRSHKEEDEEEEEEEVVPPHDDDLLQVGQFDQYDPTPTTLPHDDETTSSSRSHQVGSGDLLSRSPKKGRDSTPIESGADVELEDSMELGLLEPSTLIDEIDVVGDDRGPKKMPGLVGMDKTDEDEASETVVEIEVGVDTPEDNDSHYHSSNHNHSQEETATQVSSTSVPDEKTAALRQDSDEHGQEIKENKGQGNQKHVDTMNSVNESNSTSPSEARETRTTKSSLVVTRFASVRDLQARARMMRRTGHCATTTSSV